MVAVGAGGAALATPTCRCPGLPPCTAGATPTTPPPCAPSSRPGLGLTLLVLAALRLGGGAPDLDSPFGDGSSGFGTADALAAALWAASLYFASPVQQLAVFFGFFERERPSDWVLRRLGLAAGLDVDALGFQYPAPLRAAAVAFFVACGVGIAFSLESLLGDPTWGVSTGAPPGGQQAVGWTVGVVRAAPAHVQASSPHPCLLQAWAPASARQCTR